MWVFYPCTNIHHITHIEWCGSRETRESAFVRHLFFSLSKRVCVCSCTCHLTREWTRGHRECTYELVLPFDCTQCKTSVLNCSLLLLPLLMCLSWVQLSWLFFHPPCVSNLNSNRINKCLALFFEFPMYWATHCKHGLMHQSRQLAGGFVSLVATCKEEEEREEGDDVEWQVASMYYGHLVHVGWCFIITCF